MSVRGFRVRLLAILLSGLTLGTIGLLEPLSRFWGHFHLLGWGSPQLLLLYLGGGLVLALLSAVPVTLMLGRREIQPLPVGIAAHYATGTVCLAAVLVAAPLLRRELLQFGMPGSYLLVVPILLILAGLIVAKVTPRLITPLLGALLGRPDGRLSGLRVGFLLLLVGLLIPLTVARDVGSHHANGRPPLPARRTRPNAEPIQNVLLITIDALRADHLPTYGYARPTAPRLAGFASEGIAFDRCFAQGNVTELSFGSLFTSLYPSMHSVRRYKNLASRLPEEIETLAERLRDAGLRTAGLMPNPLLKREWGLTQGFDQIVEFHYGYLELRPVRALKVLGLLTPPERIPQTGVPRGRLVIDEALRQLTTLKAGPFFLFVHLMDVHHPYLPPESYQGLFRSPNVPPADAVTFWKRGWPIFKMIPDQENLLSEEDVQRLIDLYDGSIRYTDHQIGRLLDAVDSLGLRENTLVIVSADHGDEFLEHGNIFHKSLFLYDELTHVPLLVRAPGVAAGQRFSSLVRHIDLMPTLLALFGQPGEEAAQGQSLLPLVTGEGHWQPQPAFSQSYEFLAVRTARSKLMLDLPGDRAFCYDLEADPEEMENLAGRSAACDSLEGALLEFLKHTSVPPQGQERQQIDPRTRELLRGLGYM